VPLVKVDPPHRDPGAAAPNRHRGSGQAAVRPIDLDQQPPIAVKLRREHVLQPRGHLRSVRGGLLGTGGRRATVHDAPDVDPQPQYRCPQCANPPFGIIGFQEPVDILQQQHLILRGSRAQSRRAAPAPTHRGGSRRAATSDGPRKDPPPRESETDPPRSPAPPRSPESYQRNPVASASPVHAIRHCAASM
jgi:hypothetical protein